MNILLKALGTIVTKLFATMATEKLLEWMLFKAAEALVKSTKTPYDDEWLVEFKAAYRGLHNE